MKIIKILGILLAALLILPIIAGLAFMGLSKDMPAPGRLIDVNGIKIHINCTGSANGQPPIIIESGMGSPSFSFYWLQEHLSATNKVCTYDRPGLVWSDESGLPNDAETVSTLLHTLVDKAGIKKPFVLAGHSFGGLIMRVYADKYPDDIAALAFLDVSHPDQQERMNFPKEEPVSDWIFAAFDIYASLGLLHVFNPTIEGGIPEGLFPDEITEQFMFYLNGAKLPAAAKAEYLGFELSLAQARKVQDLGDIPTVVVVASQKVLQEDIPPFMNMTPDELAEKTLGLQQEIAALSSNSKLFKIDEADHGTLVMDKAITVKTADYIREAVKEYMRVHTTGQM